MHGSSTTEFTGKRALVTGGTRGMGAAIVHITPRLLHQTPLSSTYEQWEAEALQSCAGNHFPHRLSTSPTSATFPSRC
jgi:hypothetical protein